VWVWLLVVLISVTSCHSFQSLYIPSIFSLLLSDRCGCVSVCSCARASSVTLLDFVSTSCFLDFISSSCLLDVPLPWVSLEHVFTCLHHRIAISSLLHPPPECCPRSVSYICHFWPTNKLSLFASCILPSIPHRVWLWMLTVWVLLFSILDYRDKYD